MIGNLIHLDYIGIVSIIDIRSDVVRCGIFHWNCARAPQIHLA